MYDLARADDTLSIILYQSLFHCTNALYQGPTILLVTYTTFCPMNNLKSLPNGRQNVCAYQHSRILLLVIRSTLQ